MLKYPAAGVKVYNSSNKEITNGLIATGQKIVINYNGSQEFNVVVYGDTNGDGKVQIGDYSKIKSYIQGKIKMDNSYLEASDTNKDGKVQIGDYSKVKSYIQGKIKNLN